MAGHMGAIRVTTQNLEVLLVDDEEGLIFVKGNIPGAEGSTVTIKDAVKVAIPPNAPLPAKIKAGKAEKPAEKKEEPKAAASEQPEAKEGQ